ncbi:MAG: dTDP-4-dehydrorhamnose 3,5-epimerase family protein [Planctomycetota bacterium]|jgi:dTDP-4-dehydrorhamnose 3,5-epimerase
MTQFSDEAAARYGVQDYAPKTTIDGLEIIQLRRFNDDGGAMTELGRLDSGKLQGVDGFEVRQVNFSVMEPLVTKAFHLHKRQTDVWYVPPSDKALMCVADVRKGSPTEGVVQRIVLGDTRSMLVRIPPGVAHGIKNLMPDRTSTIIYFVDVQFSTDEHCDEGRLPWDFFGTEIWDVEKG